VLAHTRAAVDLYRPLSRVRSSSCRSASRPNRRGGLTSA